MYAGVFLTFTKLFVNRLSYSALQHCKSHQAASASVQSAVDLEAGPELRCEYHISQQHGRVRIWHRLYTKGNQRAIPSDGLAKLAAIAH